MRVRHAQIAMAYKKTYDWILDPSDLQENDPRYHIKFSDWLRSGSGIYWVSGKAGSGKSTLMKYLCAHSQTKTLLQEWASTHDLISASYFFWSAGTYMQNSQQGLLQSLLYDILVHYPGLIRTACPEKWSAALSNSHVAHEWMLPDLFQAFSHLTQLEVSRTRFCFFIDGLDEFNGDHFDIIEAIELLASSPHVKICASSRPWNIFENAFGRQLWKRLYLQDLTRADIQLYVRSNLIEHTSFAMYSLQDSRAEDLVEEIVLKAQGVFLWVFLAVRDLKKGLANEDPIDLLQRRLHRMPSELEPFFRNMLASIDDIYLGKMSCFFKAALSSSGPLPLLVYSFLDEADWNFALKHDVGPLTRKEIALRTRKITRRINSCCQGLLEIPGRKQRMKAWEQLAKVHGGFFFDVDKVGNAFGQSDSGESSEEGQQSMDIGDELSPKVDFLHRTVRDFLKTKDMHEFLMTSTPKGFNPHSALCRAFLVQIKTLKTKQVAPTDLLEDFELLQADSIQQDMALNGTPAYFRSANIRQDMEGEESEGSQKDAKEEESEGAQQGLELKVIQPIWDSIFHHARIFEEEIKTVDLEMFDELDRVRKLLIISSSWHKVYWHEGCPSVMDAALTNGLKLFLSEKLTSDPRGSYPVDGLRTPLLYSALESAEAEDSEGNLAMVRLLLDHGADPNAKHDGATVWTLFLHKVCTRWEISAKGSLRRLLHQLIGLLLHHGADPNGRINNKSVLGLYLFTICNGQGSGILDRARIEIFQTLLMSGADPNARYEHETVWMRFLRTLLGLPRLGSSFELKLTRLMLQHGANKSIQIQGPNKRTSYRLKQILDEKFARLGGSDFAELSALAGTFRELKNSRCCCPLLTWWNQI